MPITPQAPVAWGYPFDVQTRWSFYPAGSPNVVVTSFAVQGLLEGATASEIGARFATRAVVRGAMGAWTTCGCSAEVSSPITRALTSTSTTPTCSERVCVHLGLADDPPPAIASAGRSNVTLAAQAPDGGLSLRRRAGPGVARLVSHGLRATLPGGDGHDRPRDRRGRATWRRVLSAFFDAGWPSQAVGRPRASRGCPLGRNGAVDAGAAQLPGRGRSRRCSHESPNARSRRASGAVTPWPGATVGGRRRRGTCGGVTPTWRSVWQTPRLR